MAKESNLKVVIAGEFRDKGFKQANSIIGKLTESASRLSVAVGAAFAVKKVIAFGKESAKAFIADDKAAAALGVTLKNLGLNYGYNNTTIEAFIRNLEGVTAVSDDELRPAMDRLLRATGSVSKAQELLTLSLDIAAGSGKDLGQVTQSLQKAFLGQTQAIGRLGVGLSKAELASSSFEEIQARLTVLFSGQASTAADTYAGKMAKLDIAVNNVKENIGRGLIGALDGLSGHESGLDSLISKMDALSMATGDFISVLFGGKTANGYSLAQALDLLSGKAIPFTQPMTIAGQVSNVDPNKAAKEAARLAAIAARKKATADAKARAAEANKLALNKAAAAFDLTKISIAAALKGTYDKDQQLRLLAMQAIENDNGELALKYLRELSALQANADLDKLKGIKTISDAALNALDTQLLAELNVINKSGIAQEEKDAKIQIAFGKYNAALVAAGGLADANSYSEKTQILQNLVLKEASIHAGTNTAIAANALLESAQNDSIKRVMTIQALADAQRYKALQDYIALLNTLGKGVGGSGGSMSGAGTTFNPTQNKDRNFDQNILGLPPIVVTQQYPPTMIPGVTFNPSQNPDRNYDITINAGVISDPQAFTGLIQDVIQRLNRGGDPLTVAGAL